jgi:hypothetical protein
MKHEDIDHTGLTGAGGSVATDSIWDAANDLVVGSGSNTAVKWVPGSASYKRSTGDYTSNSTSFVDVDGTNLALTITTRAHRCLVSFTGTATTTGGAAGIFFEVLVDGVAMGGGLGGVFGLSVPTATNAHNVAFALITDVLSAGSHTFKLQYRTSANTVKINGDGTVYTARFSVAELVNA